MGGGVPLGMVMMQLSPGVCRDLSCMVSIDYIATVPSRLTDLYVYVNIVRVARYAGCGQGWLGHHRVGAGFARRYARSRVLPLTR
jgi:hypothetical protein